MDPIVHVSVARSSKQCVGGLSLHDIHGIPNLLACLLNRWCEACGCLCTALWREPKQSTPCSVNEWQWSAAGNTGVADPYRCEQEAYCTTLAKLSLAAPARGSWENCSQTIWLPHFLPNTHWCRLLRQGMFVTGGAKVPYSGAGLTSPPDATQLDVRADELRPSHC